MKLYVCISLDVEEEGLFSGKYPRSRMSVTNVPLLKRLAPLYRDFGFPVTLFCAYSVFADNMASEAISWMRDYCGAEIGAHLHHWSTPPLSDKGEYGPPLRTHKVDRELLCQRLETLLAAGEKIAGQPITSFRMGRWDLKSMLLPMLAEHGILVDSSICPLRFFKDGPDHFLAPADPYWVNIGPDRQILEAPITQISLFRPLARLWRATVPNNLLDCYHFLGALSANPLWHGPLAMRLATRLHTWRDGAVLNFFWHSSEMMPKGSPHIPDQAAADRLLATIFSFCRWLLDTYDVQPVTATQLAGLPLCYPERSLCAVRGQGDW